MNLSRPAKGARLAQKAGALPLGAADNTTDCRRTGASPSHKNGRRTEDEA